MPSSISTAYNDIIVSVFTPVKGFIDNDQNIPEFRQVVIDMEEEGRGPREEKDATEAALKEAARQLHDILKRLAARLTPFPAFMGMTSIQAVELEPQGPQTPDRGCVVVCPDGELYELMLGLIPGPTGLAEADPVEEFRALDLPPGEYIPYACAAITALTKRLESTSPPS